MTYTLLTNPKNTPAQARALRALSAPRMIFARTMRHYTQAMHAIWGAPDPAAVISAAGTQGAELLTRLDAAKAFLESQQAGSTSGIAATLKPRTWTAKSDGSATVAAK